MSERDGTRAWAAAALMTAIAAAGAGDDGYKAEIEAWRAAREAKLKAEDGWLSVAGLAWLHPGESRLGSDPSSDVVLPASVPANLGVLHLSEDGHAELKVEPGVSLTLAGKPFPGGSIRSDADPEVKADVLSIGQVRLILIKRGARYALRIKDNDGPLRQSFAGCRWYPISENWKVRAKFEPAPSDSKIVMDTIVGEREAMTSPGFVSFERDGVTYRLQAAVEGDSLWFVFRDATSGKTTHPGARQLSAAMPDKDGFVVLDFNKAINLPCAFTPHATCPLAPSQNRLKLAVTAGELKYDARAERDSGR